MAKSPTKEKTPESEDGGEQAEDEGEYEIEAILDVDLNAFPKRKSKIGYWCKWVGYDNEEDNTWVNEEDAENARDLIDEFWRKRKEAEKEEERMKAEKKKRGRPSESSASVTGSTNKRARKTPEPHGDDTEEEQPKSTKTARATSAKAITATTKAARKKQPSPSVSDDIVMEDGTIVGNMKKYENLKSWEDMISEVTTIEQDQATNELYFYFTLTNGDRVRSEEKVARYKFPQKMLDFYRNHLKWSQADPTEL